LSPTLRKNRVPPEKHPIVFRVISSLVPEERWLSIDAFAPLSTFFKEIGAFLKQHSQFIEELTRPLDLHLMDPQKPKEKSTVLETEPLRTIFWVQSETIRVELENTELVQNRSRSSVPHEEPHGSWNVPVTLLVWRETCFEETIGQLLETRNREAAPSVMTHRCRAPRSSISPGAPKTQGTVLHNIPFEKQGAASKDAFCSAMPRASKAARAAREEGRRRYVSRELRRLPASHDAAPKGGRKSPAGDLLRSQPQLLPGTMRTRQFEFHPSLDVLLIGDTTGHVTVEEFNPANPSSGLRRRSTGSQRPPPLLIEPSPVLALAWLRHYPQIAICGATRSGRIIMLRYEPDTGAAKPVLNQVADVEGKLPRLSSLSANCTDDFLVASGTSPNVTIYDMQTMRTMIQAPGVHGHFINTCRFCRTAPHIFATASFDHTCKVWDIRQPLVREHPITTLATGGHNVMCDFSPDDTRLLCSGLDTRVMQFDVRTWRQVPQKIPLRDPVYADRFRRSIYLTSGRHFVTAATEETHLNVMSVEGENRGTVDFKDTVQHWTPHEADQLPEGRPASVFVQSIRANPAEKNGIGVLLSQGQGKHSCVALVDLNPQCL